jgi:hypothetical protein
LRNEKVLQKVIKERNMLPTIEKNKAKSNVHILRWNCILKHLFGGKIEVRIDVTGRRGRRSKKLLGAIKKNRGYWKKKSNH